MPPTFAACAFALHWTDIAHLSFGTIENDLLRFSSRGQWKDLPLRANVMVLLRVILKEFCRVILGALAKIGCWKIGFNPAFFQTHNIGHGTIPGIAHSQLWLELPPQANPIH